MHISDRLLSNAPWPDTTEPRLLLQPRRKARINSMFDFNAAARRSELCRNIRAYLDGKGYLEVYTPTLSPYLIPEPTIKAFQTEFRNEFIGNLDLYLIPSPEIFMKRLLAAGSPSIYQISTCFRNAEQLGAIHNPEFMMLEYYTLGFDEQDSIGLTIDMIGKTNVGKGEPWMENEPMVITMAEAMERWAGVDMIRGEDIQYLKKEAERLGLGSTDSDTWDDVFNRIFLTYVETSIPTDRQVYITDYPKGIRCLAKAYEDRPCRKRWEMYINGIEVANCYDEETDKEETRSYFREEEARLAEERRGTGDAIPPTDPAFPDLDIPSSSGVAMGLDRLLAAELGMKSIEPLLLFPLSDMLNAGKSR